MNMWIVSTLLAFAAVSAGLAIWFEGRHRMVFYITKPLATGFILAVAVYAMIVHPMLYTAYVVPGLAWSLVGDVCLMFPGDKWFQRGLASFLLAHGFFIAAFLQGVWPIALPSVSIGVVLYSALLLRVVLSRAGNLKLPVLVYGLVLTAMVLAALSRWHVLGGILATFVTLAGAVSFLVSDSLLAGRTFVFPHWKPARPLVLVTYFPAVGMIALSCSLM